MIEGGKCGATEHQNPPEKTEGQTEGEAAPPAHESFRLRRKAKR